MIAQVVKSVDLFAIGPVGARGWNFVGPNRVCGSPGYKIRTTNWSWCSAISGSNVTATLVERLHDKIPGAYADRHLTTSADGTAWRQERDASGNLTETYNAALWNAAGTYIGSSPCFLTTAQRYSAFSLAIGALGLGYGGNSTYMCQTHGSTTVTIDSDEQRTETLLRLGVGIATRVDVYSDLYTVDQLFTEAQTLLNAMSIDVVSPDSFNVRYGLMASPPSGFTYTIKNFAPVPPDGDSSKFNLFWIRDEAITFFGDSRLSTFAGYPLLDVIGMTTIQDWPTASGPLFLPHGTPDSIEQYFTLASGGIQRCMYPLGNQSTPVDALYGAVAVKAILNDPAGGGLGQNFGITVLLRKAFVSGPSSIGHIIFYPQYSSTYNLSSGALMRFCGQELSGVDPGAPDPECTDSGPITVTSDGLIIEPPSQIGLIFLKCFSTIEPCDDPCE